MESWTYRKGPLKQEKHPCGLQSNIIALILELLQIFSEVIVASQCVPLARIKNQAML